MTETLTLNGVSLSSWAYLSPNVSGLFSTPERRGENVVVPGRHGAIPTPKMFSENDLVLPLWINGAEDDGSIPGGSTAAREWFARRDELLRILYADPLVLEFTRPDGTERSARVQVTGVLEFDRLQMAPAAQVNIGLTVPSGFWYDSAAVTETITGATGTVETLSVFEGATAPMTDLTITFGPCNNPQLLLGSDIALTYNGVIGAGRQLVVDTANWSLSTGVGTPWTPVYANLVFTPGPRWFSLDPTIPLEVTFNHTGGGSASVTITGKRAYLAP
jgi:hypothetical protein